MTVTPENQLATVLDRPAPPGYADLSSTRERWLTGEPAPIALVRELVIQRDVPRLRRAVYGRTELHAVLSAYGVELDVLPPGHPFDADDSPVAHAFRGLAALGLAAVEPAAADAHLGVAAAWAVMANTSPLDTADRGPGWVDRLPSQVRDLVRRWPHGHARHLAWACTTLCYLVGELPDDSAQSAVHVLSAATDNGHRMVLRLRLLPGMPRALVPDPRVMALFQGDDGFTRSLSTAWQLAAFEPTTDQAVLWSLTDAGTPPTSVDQESFGAAFAVALDELRRLRSGVRRAVTARRVGDGTSVVGKVDDDGRLCSVGGYQRKMAVVEPDDRVVVPAADVERARGERPDVDVRGADHWRQAASLARRPNRRRQLFLGLSATLVIALIVTVALVTTLGGRAGDRDRAAAARAADSARTTSGKDRATALLLAIASDALSQRAGNRTDVLASIAGTDAGGLIKILRPAAGAFSDAIISPDGRWALARSDAGHVALINANDGAVPWSTTFPPGLSFQPDQERVTTLAFSPDSRRAAFATSADRVVVLGLDRSGTWGEQARQTLPEPQQPSSLASNIDVPEGLAFSPDGSAVATWGSRLRPYTMVVSSGAVQVFPCDPGEVSITPVDAGRLVMTRVDRVDIATVDRCDESRVLTAEPRQRFWDTRIDGDTTVTLATSDAALLIRSPRTSLTIATDGPYSDARFVFRPNRVPDLSARSARGTTTWNNADKNFSTIAPRSGTLAAADDHSVWVHDGTLELSATRTSPFSALSTAQTTAVDTRWAGPHLVLGGLGGGMSLIRDAEHSSDPTAEPLDGPGGYLMDAASSPDGTLFATVQTRGLRIYDTTASPPRPQPVPDSPVGDKSTAVVFVDGDLVVGYRSGLLRILTRGSNGWTTVREGHLPAGAQSLVSRGPGDLVALTGNGRKEEGEVLAVPTADPGTITARYPVPGPLNAGRLLALPDNEIAVGYGNGTVVVLDRDLRETAPAVQGDRVNSVRSLTYVPVIDKIVVNGTRTPLVVDRPTRRVVDPDSVGFDAAAAQISASPDGRSVAVTNIENMTLEVRSLDSAELQRRACAAVGRTLSPEDWMALVGEVDYIDICPAPGGD